MEEAPASISTAAPSMIPSETRTPISYASALSRDFVTPTQSPDHSPIIVKDNDILLSSKNGFKYLHTSGEFRAKLCAPLKKALVVRVLGKKVGVQYMNDRLKAMWKPEGRMRMVDLDNDVFLAHFDNPQDYDHALTGGPWMILEHYLVCHSWDPSFRVSSDLPAKIVVWVRFPKLPYQYYQRDILTGLGNLIGSTVRIDKRTLTSARGKFARLAVEINLKEVVATGVFLDDVWQDVEYENLPSLCFDCGRIGHEVAACPRTLDASSLSFSANHVVSTEGGRPIPVAAGESQPEYGSWLTVRRKTWRPKNKEITKITPSPTVTTTLRKGKNHGYSEKRKEIGQTSSVNPPQSLAAGKNAGAVLGGQNPRDLVSKGKIGNNFEVMTAANQQPNLSISSSSTDQAHSTDRAQFVSSSISKSRPPFGPSKTLFIYVPTPTKTQLGHSIQDPRSQQVSTTLQSNFPSISVQSLSPKSTEVASSALPIADNIRKNNPSSSSIAPVNSSSPADTTMIPTTTPESDSPLFGNRSMLDGLESETNFAQTSTTAPISILQRLKSKSSSIAVRGVESVYNKPATKFDKKKKALKLTQILPLEGVPVGRTSKGVGSYTSATMKKENLAISTIVPASSFDLNRPNDEGTAVHVLQPTANKLTSTGERLDEP
ncbi:hypothetical protein LINGRAHAP2_LOCUS7367 [Linum grandiflorum]